MIRKQGRKQSGQSMVEYALGLGCISALCMVALGSLGDMSGDMIRNIEQAINYGGAKSGEFTPMVKRTATPWSIN
ncbi:hypothetical protein BH10CYA1_BH10CYA1_29940 [soil metagenome]